MDEPPLLVYRKLYLKVEAYLQNGRTGIIPEAHGLRGPILKWINDGDTNSRRQGVGRPRVIKEKGRRRLSHLVKQNRRQTVAQLTTQYNAGPSASVSEHTVQLTLLDMGLCSRRPTRVPLLTKRHRQLHLQWAREHRDWTVDEWKRLAWSDESRFLIHHVDGRVRVCRLPG
ncbi:hypothetical protein AVEN_102621-1 [Araneus ventricosus]|uniref:Transposase Tc1-like domain-containing protein n=1 Tax=Araneus ventricosus TaxID=182803 RepID=A0A4Y2BK00_ARAVE|nr:hypothetical protein AVEN_102621-1 [Araneus ventricosus]